MGLDEQVIFSDAHFFGTLRANSKGNGFRRSEFATTTATFAFVMDVYFFCQLGIRIDMFPKPSKSLSGRSGCANFGFFSPSKPEFSIDDRAKIAVISPVIGTSQNGYEVEFAVIRSHNLVGKMIAGAFGAHGKSCVSSQSEFFSIDHKIERILAPH